MSSTRLFLIALLAALAVAVSGCGGGGKSGASSESGASIVTANALAFVSVDSDLDSSQWGKVDGLSRKFPGRDKALAELKKELAEENLEWDRDIDPALGPEVDIAVARGPTLEQTAAAFLTKPDDPDKFKQLVKKLDAANGTDSTPTAVREVNGWYVAAENEAAIDRVLKGSGEALSDNGTFDDALGELPADALAKAYLNGPQVADLAREAAKAGSSTFDPDTIGLDKIDFYAASLAAEDAGIRLKGAVTGTGVSSFGGGDYSSKLLAGVPADALTFLTFDGGGLTTRLRSLESNQMFAQALRQLESTTGVSFESLLDLFANEVGFYMRPGAGIPEVSLVLEPADSDKAFATLDRVAGRVAALFGARVSSGTQDGHEVKTIDFGQVAVHYAAVGGKLLVTSGVTGIADYGSGPKLTDSADFKEAKAAAGLPDSNGGFLYLDLKTAIPLIESFAGLAGEPLPEEVAGNLRPLRSFVTWIAGSGDTRTFDAFLEIK
jgi:Protein of unknown function (DUF3352)